MPAEGIVYLVGAGPGDLGLLTVRAKELLEDADAVVYDSLIPDGILVYASDNAELHYAGKRAGQHSYPQEDINEILIRLGKEGKKVVRLKGGDPFIFGRGGEEALALKEAGIKFEIVCGVSSGAAVPVYAGIPVTQRGVATSLHLITGHEDPTKEESQLDFEAFAKVQGTLVFFMGVGNLPKIADELIKHGKDPDTPSAVIHRGCTPHQRTATGKLSEIASVVEKEGIEAPAIICIGEVCRFRDELNWFETTPLFGQSVVVTRSRSQASKLSSRLRALGALVIELPAIEIEDVDLNDDDLSKLSTLAEFDWVFFTSQNAIPSFFDNLAKLDLDSRAFSGVKIAAIGGATADALRERGLNPDLVPEKFTSAGLLAAFETLPDEERGRRALLPRADIASRELPDGLQKLGLECLEIDIYRTVPASQDEKILKQLLDGPVDYFTFASSSTVENLADMIGRGKFVELSNKSAFISIGPVTSDKIKELGGRITREAERSDIDGLVDAILADAGFENR
jgi:uroporphyrinogen III methyltransferase/synthase